MLTYRLFSFFSRLLKTVYGFFPTTDVNLSTCSDATFEKSLRTLPNNGCCSIAYSTSRLLKTVYGRFPTTDAALLLIQPQDFWKQFMDSSQQRMLIYQLVQMQPLKTVYGFLPTTDANLPTCSDATFENSLRTLPNNGCCSIVYSTSRFLKIVHGFSSNGC